MGNYSSMDISASGLTAQRVQMDLIANNIANAQTTRTTQGGPYRRQEAVFATRMEESLGEEPTTTGVEVSQIAEDSTPPKKIYEPGHPDADANGYVTLPNVNIVQEMVNMISATRAYEANVTAMSSAKSMSEKALEIGKG